MADETPPRIDKPVAKPGTTDPERLDVTPAPKPGTPEYDALQKAKAGQTVVVNERADKSQNIQTLRYTLTPDDIRKIQSGFVLTIPDMGYLTDPTELQRAIDTGYVERERVITAVASTPTVAPDRATLEEVVELQRSGVLPAGDVSAAAGVLAGTIEAPAVPVEVQQAAADTGIGRTPTAADWAAMKQIADAPTKGEKQYLTRQYQIDQGMPVTVTVDPFAFDTSRDDDLYNFIESGASPQIVDQTFGAGAYDAYFERQKWRQIAADALTRYPADQEGFIDVEAAMRAGVSPKLIDIALGEGTAAEYAQIIAANDKRQSALDVLSNYPAEQEGYIDIAAAVRAGVDDELIDYVFGEGTAAQFHEYVTAQEQLKPYQTNTGELNAYQAIDEGVDPDIINRYYGNADAYQTLVDKRQRLQEDFVLNPANGQWVDKKLVYEHYGVFEPTLGIMDIDWDRFNTDLAKVRASKMLESIPYDQVASQLYETGNEYERKIGAIMAGVPAERLEMWDFSAQEFRDAAELADPLTQWKKVTGEYYLEMSVQEFDAIEDTEERMHAYKIRKQAEDNERLRGWARESMKQGEQIEGGVTKGDIAAYKTWPPDEREQFLTENYTPEQAAIIRYEAPRRGIYGDEYPDMEHKLLDTPSWLVPAEDTIKEAVTLGNIDTGTYNRDDLGKRYDLQAELVDATMRADLDKITELYNAGAFGGQRGEAYQAYVDAYTEAAQTRRLEDSVRTGSILGLTALRDEGYFADNPQLYDRFIEYVEQGGREMPDVTQSEIDAAVLQTLGTRDHFADEILESQPELSDITKELLIGATPIYGTMHTWDDMSNGWRAASILTDILTVVPFVNGMSAAARLSVGTGKTARIAAASKAIPSLIWEEIKAPVTMVKAPVKTAKWLKQELGGMAMTGLHPKGIPVSVASQAEHTGRLWIELAGSPQDAMRIRDILMDKALAGDLVDGLAMHIEGGKVYSLRPSRVLQELGAGAAHSSPDVREMVEQGIEVKWREGQGEAGQGLFVAEEAKPRFQISSAHGDKPGKADIPKTSEMAELEKQMKTAKQTWVDAVLNRAPRSEQKRLWNDYLKVENEYEAVYDIERQNRIKYVEAEFIKAKQLGNEARAEALADELAELEYRPMRGTKYLSPEEAVRTTPTEKTYRGAAEMEKHLDVGESIAPSEDILRVFGAQASYHGVPRKFDLLDVAMLKVAGPYETIRQILLPPLMVQRYIPDYLAGYFKKIKLGAADSAQEAAGYRQAADNARTAGDIKAADELQNIANIKQQRINYIDTLYEKYADELVDIRAAGDIPADEILGELIAMDMADAARRLEGAGDVTGAARMMDASMDIRGGRITRDIRLAEDIGRTGTVSGLVRGTGELMRRQQTGEETVTRDHMGETPEPMERADRRPDVSERLTPRISGGPAESTLYSVERGRGGRLSEPGVDRLPVEPGTREVTSRPRDSAPRAPRGRVPGRRELTPRDEPRRKPDRRQQEPRTPEPRTPEPRTPGPRTPEPRTPGPRTPVVRVPPARVTPVRVTAERVPPVRTPPVRIPPTRTPPVRTPDVRTPDSRYRATWLSGRDLDKVPKSERRSITGWRQGFIIKILNTETGELWHVPEDEKPDWVRVARGGDSAYRSFSSKGGAIPSYVVPMGAQRVYVTNKGLKFRPVGGFK